MPAKIEAFFHENSNTICYVVSDPATGRAAIVDSCLDFDMAAGRTATTHADGVLAYVAAEGLTVDWILETHVHADHLSAAPYLRDQIGGKVAIGARITEKGRRIGGPERVGRARRGLAVLRRHRNLRRAGAGQAGRILDRRHFRRLTNLGEAIGCGTGLQGDRGDDERGNLADHGCGSL